MAAYYNEIDPFAAEWLRQLIKAGHIADGVVDTRSIEDVQPEELREFAQCHFFAGIGVWSLALRRAGWPDDRPVWSGSCPCQPFSSAGNGDGFADERHLWPAFHHLILVRRPPVVLGEQVASKDAEPWLDLVHTDLEALGYAFGALAFPSAGVGAPHIRDRTYWMGYAHDTGLEGYWRGHRAPQRHGEGTIRPASTAGEPLWLADAGSERFHGVNALLLGEEPGRLPQDGAQVARGRRPFLSARELAGIPYEGQWVDPARNNRPGAVNGFWGDADWLACRDGKWRPVEPGTFPLAHGAAARVGRLRGYGNAINAVAAQAFIEAVRESLPC